MDRKKIVEALFDQKIIKILKLFINNPTKEYYLREISRIVKVSPASTFRIIKKLKEAEVLYEEKTKHLKTYFLNQKGSELLSNLLEDKRSAIQEFIEFIKTQATVEMAVLNGKEEPDKASIMLVGEAIDQSQIVTKIVEIKEKYAYTIIHLVLSMDQYKQMQSMGLNATSKSVLYTKQ
jgi:DNA-binding PadR family transcriptional regulator